MGAYPVVLDYNENLNPDPSSGDGQDYGNPATGLNTVPPGTPANSTQTVGQTSWVPVVNALGQWGFALGSLFSGKSGSAVQSGGGVKVQTGASTPPAAQAAPGSTLQMYLLVTAVFVLVVALAFWAGRGKPA